MSSHLGGPWSFSCYQSLMLLRSTVHTDDDYRVRPPSTMMFCPVIERLRASVLTCSAQSYANVSGITSHQTDTLTSTVASRFSFVASRAASRFSSGNFMPHSVSSRPGDTALTRTLGEQMTASAFDK